MLSRIACFVVVILALSANALPSDQVVPDDEFTDAQSTIASMLQEGKDANACTNLANSLETIVKDNVKALQKAQDATNRGDKCKDEGQVGVSTAKAQQKEAEKKKTTATKAREAAYSAEVDFGKRTFSTLKKGNCDTFFKSTAFKAAESTYKNAQTKESQAASAVTAAKKAVANAIQAAKTAEEACKCNTFTNHNKSLSAKNKKANDANNAGWRKAAHLKCVLAGKSTNQCTVPSLPKVKSVKLCHGCNSGACFQILPDKCKGFRILPKCGGGKAALMASKASQWVKSEVYRCPEGWFWPTSAQWYAKLKQNGGCSQNNKASQKYGAAYNGKCGWKGRNFTYKNSKGKSVIQYGWKFRFSDSVQTKTFQHSGNYPGYVNSNDPETANFAGIACLKK